MPAHVKSIPEMETPWLTIEVNGGPSQSSYIRLLFSTILLFWPLKKEGERRKLITILNQNEIMKQDCVRNS